MNTAHVIIRRQWLRLSEFLSLVMGGSKYWGGTRLGLVLAAVLGWAALLRIGWQDSGLEPTYLWWTANWRYLWPALAALVGGLLAASIYAARLYNLDNWLQGLRYIVANAFSLGVPRIQVSEGKLVDVADDDSHPVKRIGGPAWVTVRPDSVVVVESLTHTTRVLGAGLHILSRLEHIREIISLADQHAATEKVTASTKDGLQVDVKRIQFRYRLHTGSRPRDFHTRSEAQPYPYSDRAAFNLAYRRSVRADGSLVPWDGAVRFAVEGVITDYINAHWFDDVANPPSDQADPRQAMIAGLQNSGLRGRLRANGTDLLWFDIGNFAPTRPEVFEQRVDNWGTGWAGRASLETAVGESHRLSANELGRAEAQAEMLTHILKSLNEVRPDGPRPQDLYNLFLLRTAQILDTMVQANSDAHQREVPPQPNSISMQRMVSTSPDTYTIRLK